MNEERRLAVLRAIVEDFVATREPVGSRALVERHGLGVSPATVRNDMAVLEEQGLIAQPHTSAGRVPTDKGYRMFVDRLTAVRPLSPAERRAIQVFLDGAVGLDDVVERTSRLLSQLTRQTAIVQYPAASLASVRHVELVPVGDHRVLVVLIVSSGRVEQRLIDLTGAGSVDEPTVDALGELRARINVAVEGRRLADAAAGLDALRSGLSHPAVGPAGPTADQQVSAALLTSVADLMREEREERIVVAGTSHLVRRGTEFAEELGSLIEALEEQVVLLHLLHEMAEGEGDVAVRIGHENAHDSLNAAAIVSSAYSTGGQVSAQLGVLGPTRMDYPATIAAVRAVARYVSGVLEP
jgi:heat-inducible transcriptional repressor